MQDPATSQTPVPRFVTSPPPLPSGAGPVAELICPACGSAARRPAGNHDPGPPALSTAFSSQPFELRCPFCSRVSHYRLFPRMACPPLPPAASALAENKDATCPFFPELKADLVCDECGTFMSHQASLHWDNRHLCLPCLHTLRERKSDPAFQSQLKIWDNRALFLLLLLPFTLITGPVAVYQLIRYRKAPRGWPPRSAFRWWLAAVLAMAIFAGWLALIVIWVAVAYREIGRG